MYKILIKLNLTTMSVITMNELIRCKENRPMDNRPLTLVLRRLAKYGKCNYDFTYGIGRKILEDKKYGK